jgi:hypothetical protein
VSTTYVFGAGASRDIGYPLASEMGGQLLHFMQVSHDSIIEPCGELLIDTYGESLNVEDLITELQSLVASLKDSQASEDKARRSKFGTCLGWAGVALQQWFKEIHTRPAPDYETSRKVGHLTRLRVSAGYRKACVEGSPSETAWQHKLADITLRRCERWRVYLKPSFVHGRPSSNPSSRFRFLELQRLCWAYL